MNKDLLQPTTQKRRRTVSLEKKRALSGWIFVLPFILGFALIYLPIVFDSIKMSFNEIRTVAGVGYRLIPVGFKNYSVALFEDEQFVQILITGLTQLVFDIPAIVIFSLFMAVILNQKMFGRAVFRAIFFVPVILSTGLISQIDVDNAAINDYMSNNESIDPGMQVEGQTSASDIISYADVTNLFSTMKVGGELVVYVTNLVNDIYNIINRSGVQMLIFLAGLQSISPAIYESCSIDGATSWETFWKITFPMISPMILVNAVYTVIDSFTSADNQVMSFVTSYYEQSEVVSSAMSWIYFAIVIVIVAVVASILSTFIFYQRRD